jgi:RNA polymerase sigma-70 factor (ECF subfamily)
MGQLPEEERAALLLIGLEGLSYAGAAAALRISAATLRSRLASGRANLCRLMGVPRVLPATRAAA